MAKITDPDDLDPTGTAEIETELLEIQHGNPAGVGYTPGSAPSEITARIVAPNAPNKRQLTWEFIDDAGDFGATHDETVAAGINAETGGARMSELKDLGRIKDTGRMRDTRQGCPAGVWVSLPFEEWKDKRRGFPMPLKNRSPRSRKSRLRYAKKSFYEILDRLESGGLFALTEVEQTAKRALDVLG